MNDENRTMQVKVRLTPQEWAAVRLGAANCPRAKGHMGKLIYQFARARIRQLIGREESAK